MVQLTSNVVYGVIRNRCANCKFNDKILRYDEVTTWDLLYCQVWCHGVWPLTSCHKYKPAIACEEVNETEY
jgi:hypothetical protein